MGLSFLTALAWRYRLTLSYNETVLKALAWRYRLTLSHGHGFQSFFPKRVFISVFFLGDDVVAGNLFLSVHPYMYVENIDSLYNYLYM